MVGGRTCNLDHSTNDHFWLMISLMPTMVNPTNSLVFSEYLAKLDKGEALPETSIHVCQYCGNTVEGEAPDKCPICGAPKKMFKSID